jgi:hypothetical protein
VIFLPENEIAIAILARSKFRLGSPHGWRAHDDHKVTDT